MTDDNASEVMRKLNEFGQKLDNLSNAVAELKAAHITPQQVDDKIAEAGKKSQERMDDTLKDFKAQIMQSVQDTLNATIRKAAESLADTVDRASQKMTDHQDLLDQRDKLHEAAAAQRAKVLEALEERTEQAETNAAIAKARVDEIALHLYGDQVNPGLIQQFKESLDVMKDMRDLKKAEDKRQQDEADRKKEIHQTVMTILDYFPQTKRAKRITAGLSLPVTASAYAFITNFGSILSWIAENVVNVLGG